MKYPHALIIFFQNNFSGHTHWVRGDTHKKSVFFSGQTTKGLPSLQ